MTAATLIALRKELKHLPTKGVAQKGNATLPLRIVGPNANYAFSEAECCFIWDDDNEVVYIVMPNTVHTQTTDSRLYPMSIMALEYGSIEFVSVPCARNELDYFLDTKEQAGQVGSATRQRYFNDLTDLADPRTYTMGEPSPTTEKRPLNPDDEIISKDVNFC